MNMCSRYRCAKHGGMQGEVPVACGIKGFAGALGGQHVQPMKGQGSGGGVDARRADDQSIVDAVCGHVSDGIMHGDC